MREIKFRAWLPSMDEMFKPTNKSMSIFNDGSFNIDGLPCEGGILMQYTGLKDKNGTEVFEGDIFHIGYNHLGNNTCKMVNGQWNFAKYDHRKCRVIGNIHEHPELLKQ